MADQDIKDFTVNWVLFGLLFFCLMSFVLIFTYNNNPDALGDSYDKIDFYRGNINSQLTQLESSTNENINSSAILGSEEAQVGIRASSSTSYGFMSTSRNFWDTTKGFIGWIFSGDLGTLLISVFGGLFGVVALYYIIKLLRSLF